MELRPPEVSMPSLDRLFRHPAQLTDEQFDLLAAAWAEGDLEDEALQEMEEIMSATPERRERAESFRQLRLEPATDRWSSMRGSLRPVPAARLPKRRLITATLAAAALLILLIMGPARKWYRELPAGDPVTTATEPVPSLAEAVPQPAKTETPPAEAGAPEVGTEPPPAEAKVLLAETGAGPAKIEPPPAEAGAPEAGTEPLLAEAGDLPLREMLLITDHNLPVLRTLAPFTEPAMASGTMARVTMARVTMAVVPDYQHNAPDEQNWILRGLSMIAKAVTGKEREVTRYSIANSCVAGINSLLGWEMELEQLRNESGEPVALSFSSSLLSFRRPLK